MNPEKNHLFTSTATYRKTDYFFGEALRKRTSRPKKCSNLNAFGATLPGRNFNSNSYRYGGAGGQEKDDEITGVTGSHYTAEFWEYDSRLIRRWNMDPKPTGWESPYAAFRNNPIYFIDPDGDIPIGAWFKKAADNIGSLFTKEKWNGPDLVGKRDVPKQRDWGGLANIFRRSENHVKAPWGKRVNSGWQTVASNVSISGKGNPMDRTDLYDFGGQLPRYGDRIIGLQITGNTNGGWGSFLRAKGSDGSGGGVSIANSGLQNIFPTWADPRSMFDFEARSGIIPGLNFLPTIFNNYAGDNLWLKYGLLAGTIGYMNNFFNYVSPVLRPVKAIEIQYRSMSNIPATYTMQIKTRTTIRNSSTLWRRLWYGY